MFWYVIGILVIFLAGAFAGFLIGGNNARHARRLRKKLEANLRHGVGDPLIEEILSAASGSVAAVRRLLERDRRLQREARPADARALRPAPPGGRCR